RNWQVLAQEPPYAPVYAGSALGDAAWLLAVGGNCCGVGAAGSGEVRISALHPDGSGDVWSLAGEQFQPRATRAGVAFDRMHLYVIGGFWWSGGAVTGYATDLVHVHVADLTSDGRIGRWRSGTPLPRAGRAIATSLNGRIYALVTDSEFPLSAMVYAEPAADGSIVSWREASARGAFTNVKALTTAAGRLYVADSEGRMFVGTVTPEGDVSSWSHWPAENLGEEARALSGSERRLYLLGRDSVLVATV